MSHSLAAWCMLAAETVLSVACSYFLFTEMKILSTKKTCLGVRVCLHRDESDRITGFFFFPVSTAALAGGILVLVNCTLPLPAVFFAVGLRFWRISHSPCRFIKTSWTLSWYLSAWPKELAITWLSNLSGDCQHVLFSVYSLKKYVLSMLM